MSYFYAVVHKCLLYLRNDYYIEIHEQNDYLTASS